MEKKKLSISEQVQDMCIKVLLLIFQIKRLQQGS